MDPPSLVQQQAGPLPNDASVVSARKDKEADETVAKEKGYMSGFESQQSFLLKCAPSSGNVVRGTLVRV